MFEADPTQWAELIFGNAKLELRGQVLSFASALQFVI